MDDFLEEIEEALNAGLYQVALMMAMTLPDMCAALENPKGTTDGARYRDWYDGNMLGGYLDRPYGDPSAPGLYDVWLSSDDCWKFRCSLLHQGRGTHPSAPSKRILFLEPGAGPRIHLGRGRGGLLLDLPTFVHDMMRSVRKWQKGVEGTEPYESNLKSFIRRHPEGIEPFVVGAPVIG